MQLEWLNYNPSFFRLQNHFITTIIIVHNYSHKDGKFCILEFL